MTLAYFFKVTQAKVPDKSFKFTVRHFSSPALIKNVTQTYLGVSTQCGKVGMLIDLELGNWPEI